MLKFEHVAKVGDTIRAYDFQPRLGGAKPCYIEGVVKAKGPTAKGFDAYEVEVAKDVWAGDDYDGKYSRIGEIVYVPFEVSMLEWSGRIVKL